MTETGGSLIHHSALTDSPVICEYSTAKSAFKYKRYENYLETILYEYSSIMNFPDVLLPKMMDFMLESK